MARLGTLLMVVGISIVGFAGAGGIVGMAVPRVVYADEGDECCLPAYPSVPLTGGGECDKFVGTNSSCRSTNAKHCTSGVQAGPMVDATCEAYDLDSECVLGNMTKRMDEWGWQCPGGVVNNCTCVVYTTGNQLPVSYKDCTWTPDACECG